MDDWFGLIRTGCELSGGALKDLQDFGFVVIPGPVESADLPQIAAAYDSVVVSALSNDIKIGSSTTRVTDFVNREQDFDALYIHQPVLEACSHVIGKPFKISSLHARTLHPNSQAQKLHIDFKPNEERFPLLSFIFMVDEFREDNGATGFVPGSHKWSKAPDNLTNGALTDYENQIRTACGQAGSVIVFNGSVWHGHTANLTDTPRRSIQGAYIPRDAQSAIDFKSRMRSATLTRISPLAKYLLAI
ncbi:MAG TPA: phytanoyl-CoA dioxygenase family protein [Pyrinomonadaceae bacterium]|jgi:ectoine hydroxylase-related dioxygenase (phytanoyl-CoA dioxygenase family)